MTGGRTSKRNPVLFWVVQDHVITNHDSTVKSNGLECVESEGEQTVKKRPGMNTGESF